MTTPEKPGEGTQDFSLVLGGPLYQMFRRAWLSGDTLELTRRRIGAICAISWLPLLLLTLWEGTAWRGKVHLPFLLDLDLHARLLVAVPLLVVAELVVHMRMRPVVRQFLERELIPDHARERFEAALASAVRLRNSVSAEVLMIAFVYGVGVFWLWRRVVALDVGSWYGTVAADGLLQPSLAGWWYGCVSLPIAQFLLLRWYFRIFIWARLLWRVSRMDLALVPTHPDRVGGLGFLGNTAYAFTPVLLAQGALVSGMIANRIFFTGAALPHFKVDLVGVVVLVVFMVMGPLVVFAPLLERTKRQALREYGTLAQHYVRGFDRKWLRGGAGDEAFLGSADIQSLADLGNSFDIVREMRLIPFTYRNVVQLAVVTLIPVLPLALTMFSLEELVQRMLKVAF